MSNLSAQQAASAAQWLDAAVVRLRAAFDPSLVLLFGSRARGTATRRSDLDLLLVCETADGPLERIGRVLRLLQDSPWPVEPVVLTPGELEAMSHRPFIRRMLAAGRVLYER